MNLIWIYLLLGLGTLPIMAFEWWWQKRNKTNEFLENFIAHIAHIDNPHPAWHERLRDKVLIPLRIAMTRYLLWPLYIGLLLGDKWEKARSKPKHAPRFQRRKFAITIADLGIVFSRAEIEEQNQIYDPMGAVPPLPFGHLNPVWARFVEGLEGDETLYSFDAPWHEWVPGRRRGYVAVKDGVPGRFLITDEIFALS